MRFEFELTAGDLESVHRQLAGHRAKRVRESPITLGVAVVVAAIVVWPLWRTWLLADDPGPLGVAAFAGVVAFAAAIAFATRRILPVPRYRRLRAWSARRSTKAALKRSVLGPVVVEVTEQGFVRTNTADTRTFGFAEAKWLLDSPGLLTVVLRKDRRVLLLPDRVFPNGLARDQVKVRLEQATGLAFVTVES